MNYINRVEESGYIQIITASRSLTQISDNRRNEVSENTPVLQPTPFVAGLRKKGVCYGFQLCHIAEPGAPVVVSKVSRFMMVEYSYSICDEDETECVWKQQGDIDMELAPLSIDAPLGEWSRVSTLEKFQLANFRLSDHLRSLVLP